MYSQVAVVGRAVEAEVNSKWHRGPSGILSTAVEAYLPRTLDEKARRSAEDRGGADLICGLRLELVEDFLRLGLGSLGHDGQAVVAEMVERGGVGGEGCTGWRLC